MTQMSAKISVAITEGQPYDPWRAQLRKARQHSQQVLTAFNALAPTEESHRSALLQQLIKRISSHQIGANFQVEYGCRCSFGKAIFINHNVTLIDAYPITIGNQVLIGPNTVISTVAQRFTLEPASTEQGQAINIGHRVWIGANVRIGPGVSIGDNAVIGAGSWVTTDIPANFIAYGNPAVSQRKIQQSTQ